DKSRYTGQSFESGLSADGQSAQLAFIVLRDGCRSRADAYWRMTRYRCGDRRAASAIGNVNKVQIEDRAEELSCQVRAGADSGRGVAVFAGICFYQRYKFLQVVRRYGRVHRDYLHCRGGYSHRVEVGDWIIKRIFLKHWIGDERDAVHEEDRVTVRGSLGCTTRTNAAAGSSDVLDIELFAQAIGQFLRNE